MRLVVLVWQAHETPTPPVRPAAVGGFDGPDVTPARSPKSERTGYTMIIRHSPPRPEAKSPWRLIEEIVALSVAGNWGEARAEWALAEVYVTETPGACLCGHSITEHCLLLNQLNGNEAVVGNHCVKRFLDIPSESIFAVLRRIAHNTAAALNEAVIEYAHSKGWINDWEAKFSKDTSRKRRLSPKHRAKRVEINERVLALVGGKAVADA